MLFDITQTGLDLGLGVALGILPRRIPGIEGCASGCGDWGTCFEEDYFGVFDGLVALEPVAASVTGNSDGVLRALVELSVSLNDPGNPFLLEYDAFCFAGTCDGWVNAFPVYARIDLAIVEVMTDTGLVIAPQIVDLDVSYSVADDDLNTEGCSLDARDIALFWHLGHRLGFAGGGRPTGNLTSQLKASTPPGRARPVLPASIDESFELTEGLALDVAVGLNEVLIGEEHAVGPLRWCGCGEAAPCVEAYDQWRASHPSDAPGLGELNSPTPSPTVARSMADDFVNPVYAAEVGSALSNTGRRADR